PPEHRLHPSGGASDEAPGTKVLRVVPVTAVEQRPSFQPEALHPSEKGRDHVGLLTDRKSTRLNSSHVSISYAVFCLKKKKQMILALGGGDRAVGRRAARRSGTCASRTGLAPLSASFLPFCEAHLFLVLAPKCCRGSA